MVRNTSKDVDPSSNSNCSHQASSTWLLLHCAGCSVRNVLYSGLKSSKDTCSSVRRKGPRPRPRIRSRRLLKSSGVEGGSKDKLESRCEKRREACTKCVARESPRLDLYLIVDVDEGLE
jgi:hypothetical protein